MAYATLTDLNNSGLPPKATTGITTDQKQAALNNASSLMDGYLNARFVLPLIPDPSTGYPYDLVLCCCNIASWYLLALRGYDPSQGADLVVRQRYEDAMRWLNDVANERVQPVVVDSSSNGDTSQAPAVLSSPPRGWEWLPGYGFGPGGCRGW